MPKFINVRGCNGSGKTTLLRSLARDPLCKVVNYNVLHEYKPKPGKKKPLDVTIGEDGRSMVYHPPIPVTFCPGGIAILGDYTRNADHNTTAGCNHIKTQEATKNVLELIAKENPDLKAILFEGVVVSTIFKPWLDWSRNNGGMIWAFINTPLSVCLGRISERNGGKPIKEDQVAAKHETIERVWQKALAEGEHVCILDWMKPLAGIKFIMRELEN